MPFSSITVKSGESDSFILKSHLMGGLDYFSSNTKVWFDLTELMTGVEGDGSNFVLSYSGLNRHERHYTAVKVS